MIRYYSFFCFFIAALLTPLSFISGYYSLGYVRHLFGTRVQKYITDLTSKVKPKKVLICVSYFDSMKYCSVCQRTLKEFVYIYVLSFTGFPFTDDLLSR